MAEQPDLSFVLARLDAIQAEQRAQRAEMRELTIALREMAGASNRRFDAVGRHLDQISDQLRTVHDDLAVTIKIEMGGRFAETETRLEQRLDDRLAGIERRLGRLEKADQA